MNNLLRAEWYKINRNKTFWTLIITMITLSTLLHVLIMTDWWFMSGTPFDRAGLSKLNALSVLIVPLFFNILVSTLAGFFIATEFTPHSVMKNQIISGNKRSHIFIAKYLVFTIGAFIVTIAIPFVAAVGVYVLVGEGDLFTVSNLIYLGRAYSLFTIHFFSFTGIVFLIAIVTEDSGKTILYTLILSIVMFAIEKFVTNSLVKAIYDHTFFYHFNEAFQYTMTSSEIIKSILIGLISFVVIILFGTFMFQRKEIK